MAVTEQGRQRRYVCVGAEQPAHVADALLGGGAAGADEHVRFRVHPGDGPHPCGDRQGQLASPASKIDCDVVAGQAKCVHERVDHGRRVAAAVLVVEVGDLATETQVHSSSLPSRGFAAIAIQRSARAALVPVAGSGAYRSSSMVVGLAA